MFKPNECESESFADEKHNVRSLILETRIEMSKKLLIFRFKLENQWRAKRNHVKEIEITFLCGEETLKLEKYYSLKILILIGKVL